MTDEVNGSATIIFWPLVCKAPDCQRPHKARGYCRLHYERLRLHGDAAAVLPSGKVKHGQSYRGQKTAEYKTWASMRQRCLNPRNAAWSNYGGRGITICDRWLNNFDLFYADMGPKPSGQHSIDRIDNDGNYEPGNCRWATRLEQNRNRRRGQRALAKGQRTDTFMGRR